MRRAPVLALGGGLVLLLGYVGGNLFPVPAGPQTEYFRPMLGISDDGFSSRWQWDSTSVVNKKYLPYSTGSAENYPDSTLSEGAGKTRYTLHAGYVIRNTNRTVLFYVSGDVLNGTSDLPDLCASPPPSLDNIKRPLLAFYNGWFLDQKELGVLNLSQLPIVDAMVTPDPNGSNNGTTADEFRGPATALLAADGLTIEVYMNGAVQNVNDICVLVNAYRKH